MMLIVLYHTFKKIHVDSLPVYLLFTWRVMNCCGCMPLKISSLVSPVMGSGGSLRPAIGDTLLLEESVDGRPIKLLSIRPALAASDLCWGWVGLDDTEFPLRGLWPALRAVLMARWRLDTSCPACSWSTLPGSDIDLLVFYPKPSKNTTWQFVEFPVSCQSTNVWVWLSVGVYTFWMDAGVVPWY